MSSRLLLGVSLVVLRAMVVGAEGRTAYETLRAAPQFATGQVGSEGETSAQEIALNNLLSEPDAPADLRRLLAEATRAGQLYALWGLAVLRDKEFEKLSEKYVSSDAQVETMRGCIVESESVSSIVKRIREGAYGKPAK
jgi:hypothetical protein